MHKNLQFNSFLVNLFFFLICFALQAQADYDGNYIAVRCLCRIVCLPTFQFAGFLELILNETIWIKQPISSQRNDSHRPLITYNEY